MHTPRPGDGRAGTSLVQATLTLTALGVLAGVSTPAVSTYVRRARTLRARMDQKTMAAALHLLLDDVGCNRVAAERGGNSRLLVTRGGVPESATPLARNWVVPTRKHHVGRLDILLGHNRARQTGHVSGAKMAGWNGPYINLPPGPDPWGNRYALNAASMGPGSPGVAVIVSAGPDGKISVPFELAPRQVGRKFGDDVYFPVE